MQIDCAIIPHCVPSGWVANLVWLFSLSLEVSICNVALLGNITVPVNESESEDVSGNMVITSLLEILEDILNILTVVCLFLKYVNKSRYKA